MRRAKFLLLSGILAAGVVLWSARSLTVEAFGNRFIFTQLKHQGLWDPYPSVHEAVLKTLGQMTNIPFESERRVVTLQDPELFKNPFLLVKGSQGLTFNESEKTNLKKFIDRGGFVIFDDTTADPGGPFSRSVRKILSDLYPQNPLQKLPMDHALFRSFFLLQRVGGRRISSPFLEGLEVGGQGGGESRTAVLYSANDILGAWMKDSFGNYVYSCEPGGESQRWESFKLTVNLIYFHLTGTYKQDAVHQPFIEKKLGL